MNGFSRRDFGLLATAAAGAVTLTACTSTPANAGPPPAPRNQLGPIKQIDAGDLNVGYAEAGPPDGQPVILLHGWPYDIHSYADVTAMLA
ncbi:alpha/beta fold hydrolase, partial [Mycolicibacterium austroafricanum]